MFCFNWPEPNFSSILFEKISSGRSSYDSIIGSRGGILSKILVDLDFDLGDFPPDVSVDEDLDFSLSLLFEITSA